MKINKDNYELFFLDYHEGNLPAEQAAELFLFLEQNPALKAEFNSFENISLPAQKNISFPGKDSLKRGVINETNYTGYFIRYVEKTLSDDEKKLLENFLIAFPGYNSELSLFEKTKLVPDLSIVYLEKSSLKKPIPLFNGREAWYYLAAAACIILLMGVLFINKENSNSSQMAHRVTPSPIHSENTEERKRSSGPVKHSDKTNTAITSDHQGNSGNLTGKQQLKKGKHRKKKTTTDEPQQFANRTNHSAKNRTVNSQAPSYSRENIAYLMPLELHQESVIPEIACAEPLQKKESELYFTMTASTDNLESYPTLGKVLSQYSIEKLKQSIQNKPLANELVSSKIPGKIKGIKFVGWCYEKVTGKKVNVKTTYDHQGNLTAYHISSGRFQYGKTFASR